MFRFFSGAASPFAFPSPLFTLLSKEGREGGALGYPPPFSATSLAPSPKFDLASAEGGYDPLTPAPPLTPAASPGSFSADGDMLWVKGIKGSTTSGQGNSSLITHGVNDKQTGRLFYHNVLQLFGHSYAIKALVPPRWWCGLRTCCVPVALQ